MAETRRHSQLMSLRSIFAGIIDPKLTIYHGITMRSRLEADFARHLDELRIVWRYEPAVFGPTGQGYLPDFEILGRGERHYVEVKPTLREVAGAKRKMAVIWQIYPAAVLVVACAEGSRFFASDAGADWITWTDRWSHA